jgi:hypothetical protein
MGPLSAVATSFFLVLYGLTGIAWITASPKALGTVALVSAVLVLLDTFWVNSGRWLAGRRGE